MNRTFAFDKKIYRCYWARPFTLILLVTLPIVAATFLAAVFHVQLDFEWTTMRIISICVYASLAVSTLVGVLTIYNSFCFGKFASLSKNDDCLIYQHGVCDEELYQGTRYTISEIEQVEFTWGYIYIAGKINMREYYCGRLVEDADVNEVCIPRVFSNMELLKGEEQ